MKSFLAQLKQVVRRLARTPMFTIVTIVTLAAGIGANTAVFSVLESVMIRPLPYPHSDRLAAVWLTAPGINIPNLDLSPSDYFVFRDQSTTFEDLGLYQGDSFSVTGVGQPEQVPALRFTDGLLPILGVHPAMGRGFTRQDDSPGAPKTLLISYGYWQSKFGGDPNAIGKTLLLDGEQYQIIGVTPKGFHFLDWTDRALMVPFQFDRNKIHLGNFSYQGVARLKPGVTMAQINADIARMLPIVRNTFNAPPGFSIKLFDDAKISPNVHTLKKEVVGDVGGSLWILMGSIGLVMLIACANVANLLLVRVEGRRQELALRAALGANWTRIAGELLFESLTIGIVASFIGLGLAWASLRILVGLAPSGIPRLNEIGIDSIVLLFNLGVAILASILFGAVPVFKYAGAHLNTGIREGGRALSQSREQHRARNTLVVIQVALALILLICSGLMIRTFRALAKIDPGFVRADQLQIFRISIPETEIKENEKVARAEEEILHRIQAIPGVTSAAIGTNIPMMDSGWNDPIFLEGHNYGEGELPPIRRFKFVSPGLIATLGTPLLAGRDLTWDDIYQRRHVAMITESIAREYWPTPGDALGKRIRVGTEDYWREIIGVVGNTYDNGVNAKPVTAVYWPLLMDKFEGNQELVRRDVAYVIRSPRAGTEALMKSAREAVWATDPNLPLSDVHTLDYYYRRSMARTSFTLVMLGVAGGMALLLGVVGIYGVIAYSVSQRTREIGIRIALGAQQQTVTGMFVRQGLTLSVIGVVIGVAVAFGIMRLMSTVLFRVSPTDPVTYIAVSLGLIFTAFLASYLPSRRAAQVDPVDALRAE